MMAMIWPPRWPVCRIVPGDMIYLVSDVMASKEGDEIVVSLDAGPKRLAVALLEHLNQARIDRAAIKEK